ncbi:hypothetical protein ACFO3I_14295 [Rheinheimera marina]|uniref:Uncharacterized protein n=1 Tax=Rheinheimera marina TaxID=1774958 RepID=A0ABV9JPJ6_9GAMM
MAENKYMASPNSDIPLLFEHVFGVNFTRAALSGETPTKEKWVQPLFNSRNDALLFQDLLIGRLMIDPTSTDKLETELLGSNMNYDISQAVLLKLRDEVETFLKDPSTRVQGSGSVLELCGLGCAGVPLMYDSYNQSMTATDLVKYLNSLTIDSRASLKIYVSSNSSAAACNYCFNSIQELRDQFAISLKEDSNFLASLIGTKGSLAAELYKALNSQGPDPEYDYSHTEVYGYLFPFLSVGAEAYGVDVETKTLSKWMTPSMAAITPALTKDKEYYQRVLVRRSLTKARMQ